MSRKKAVIPLDFSKGVHEHFESSVVPEGYATVLRNWVPEANGVLRVPRRFLSASTGNLSGTLASRGLGTYMQGGAPRVAVAQAASSTEYRLLLLDRDQISTGSWSNEDTVSVADTSGAVAFAAGAGVLLYCSPGFAQIRAWDGSAASDASADGIAGRCLAYHQNRFFVGGIPGEETNLRWSEIGDATTWTPDLNFQPVGADDGEPLEDLSIWDGLLWIGKESSIWYMTGTGPDNFAWKRATGGECAPGRTLIPTPDGLIACGPERVYLLTGAGFEPISRPIERSYGMTGEFLSGVFIDGRVYICDEASGTVFRFDMETGAWSVYDVDDPDEGPGVVGASGPYLLAGTRDAQANSILLYREEPGGERGLPEHLGQTFEVSTGDLWLSGAAGPWSAVRLNMLVRQLAGDERGTSMAVEVWEPTDTLNPAHETSIGPFPIPGTHRVSKSLGQLGKYSMRLDFRHIAEVTDATLYHIERAELEVEFEEGR